MIGFVFVRTIEEYQKALTELPGSQGLFFFQSGTITIETRGEVHALEGPRVVNHSPLAQTQVLKGHWEGGFFLWFQGVDQDLLVARAFLLLCPMTGMLHMGLLGSEFQTLSDVFSLMARAPASQELLLIQAQLVVKYLVAFQTGENSRRFVENSLVKNYVATVDRDHLVSHEITYYAQELGVSLRTLNRTFKEFTGITPKTSLNYRLNLAAKNQLLERTKSVKEISYHLGFRSPEYFHMFFRKSNGISPLEYGRQSQGPA